MNSRHQDACDRLEARASLQRDMGRANVWAPILEEAVRADNGSYYVFQRAGAKRLSAMLNQWGGALLADAPGLGKTRTSLLAADLLGANALVVAPAALRAQWEKERDGLPVVSHAMLHTRFHEIEAMCDHRRIDLIIIDEAHGFRTADTRRYSSLQRLGRGRRLLFVSATMIHNRTSDILSLLRLFLGQRDIIEITGGYAWEDMDGGNLDALQSVLDQVCVRRSRRVARLIESQLVGAPEHRLLVPPGRREETFVPTFTSGLTDFTRATRLLALAMALHDEPAELLESVLLRRAASSYAAFLQSLQRISNYVSRRRDALVAGADLSRDEFRRAFGDDEHTQLDQGVLPFWFVGLPRATVDDLDYVASKVACVLQHVDCLHELDRERARRVLEIARESGRTLAFTEYRATAGWLAQVLNRKANLCCITGGMSSTEILEAAQRFCAGDFAFSSLPGVLIATPVGMEGLNLQSADSVIHLDLPWTAARLEQRTGRADRIGRSSLVAVHTFAPPAAFESRIQLVASLERKASLHGMVVGRLDGQAVDSALEYASRLAISGATMGPRLDRTTRYYGIRGTREALLVRDRHETTAFHRTQSRWTRIASSVLLRDLANLIDSGAPVWSADDQDFHVLDLVEAAESDVRAQIVDAHVRTNSRANHLTPFLLAARNAANLCLTAGDEATALWFLESLIPSLTVELGAARGHWRRRILATWPSPPLLLADWVRLHDQLVPTLSMPSTHNSLAPDSTFVAIIYPEFPDYCRDSFAATDPNVSRETSLCGGDPTVGRG